MMELVFQTVAVGLCLLVEGDWLTQIEHLDRLYSVGLYLNSYQFSHKETL